MTKEDWAGEFTKGAEDFIILFSSRSWGFRVDFKKAALQCKKGGLSSYAQQKELVCQGLVGELGTSSPAS